MLDKVVWEGQWIQEQLWVKAQVHAMELNGVKVTRWLSFGDWRRTLSFGLALLQ